MMSSRYRAIVALSVVVVVVAGTTACASSHTGPAASDWEDKIEQVPLPGPGCFRAEPPDMRWTKIDCVAPPNYPMTPRHGALPATAGNGNDFAVGAPTGTTIATAEGSFDNVTNVNSVSSEVSADTSPTAGAFTLQLNTNTFANPSGPGVGACPDSATNPACHAWQQFVFENFGPAGRLFIQYWLLKYNQPCPSGWMQFQFSGESDIYCFRNNPAAAPATKVDVGAPGILGHTRLRASTAGGAEQVVLYTPNQANGMLSSPGDAALTLAGKWQTAEFNLLGDGGDQSGGNQAILNAGASLTVRTRLIDPAHGEPSCVSFGTSGETNNLGFGTAGPAQTQPGPAVLFTETHGQNQPTDNNCLNFATTVGDTHLTTFGGLLYDFQATGDFVLARTDPGFEVQTRQINLNSNTRVAYNGAIAARADVNGVAVCAPPAELGASTIMVDGTPKGLANGATLSLSGGGSVSRTGNVVLIRDAEGNTVRITGYGTWMKAVVGLGTWPTAVSGLLASVKDNGANLLRASTGQMYKSPVPVADFYGVYGKSWRVPAGKDLLDDCGVSVPGPNPTAPFYLNDRSISDQARGTAATACSAVLTNVKGEHAKDLSDACGLDVVVLGSGAVAPYSGVVAPTDVVIIQ